MVDHPRLLPRFDIAGTNALKGLGFLKQAASERSTRGEWDKRFK